MTSYVIHALVQKRAEPSGDIENSHNNLRRMIQELEHLDKTPPTFDSGLSGGQHQAQSLPATGGLVQAREDDAPDLGNSEEGIRDRSWHQTMNRLAAWTPS